MRKKKRQIKNEIYDYKPYMIEKGADTVEVFTSPEDAAAEVNPIKFESKNSGAPERKFKYKLEDKNKGAKL